MSRKVQEMFSTIASGYDRANTVLSLGIHHLWRRSALRLLEPRADERFLDVCCGTGDVAFALARRLGEKARIAGADFCLPMLELARDKAARRGAGGVGFVQSDARALPFEDGTFDAATCAFGIRNVEDPVRGLREMCRVVRPGGRVVVLEFGQPQGAVFSRVYGLYTQRLLPRLGHWVTGQRAAYEYLQRTAAAFPAGAAFLGLMHAAGLERAQAHPLSLGIAFAYRGEVPAGRQSDARGA